MSRPLIRLPVTLENFLFLQLLFWKKRKLETKHSFLGQPHSRTAHAGIRSPVFWKDRNLRDASLSHASLATHFYQLPDKQRGRGGSIWPELLWSLRHSINWREETELANCRMHWHSLQQSILGKATYITGMEGKKIPPARVCDYIRLGGFDAG